MEFQALSDKKNYTEKMILIDHSNFKLGFWTKLWFLTMTNPNSSIFLQMNAG